MKLKRRTRRFRESQEPIALPVVKESKAGGTEFYKKSLFLCLLCSGIDWSSPVREMHDGCENRNLQATFAAGVPSNR